MKRPVVFCLLLAAGLSVAAPAESPVAPAEKQPDGRATDQRPTPEAVREYVRLLNAQPSESGEEVLRFFRLAETVVAEIDWHNGGLISFSSDGRTLATGVAVWNVETGKRISRRERGARVAALFPDGKTLAAGGGGERLAIYRTADATLISKFDAVPGYAMSADVLSVAVSPQGNQVAAVGRWRLWLFDVAGKLQRDEVMSNLAREGQVAHAGTALRVVAYSPDGNVIACGPWFNRQGRGKPVGKLVLWDVRNWNPLATLDDTAFVGAVDFSADGKLLATADEKGYRDVHGSDHHGESGPILRRIRIWGAKTGKGVAYNWSAPRPDYVSFRHQADRGVSVSFSPDGKILATGGYRTICLWDVATWGRLLALKASEDRDVVVKFSPDGSRLAVSGGRVVKICDTAKLLALVPQRHNR